MNRSILFAGTQHWRSDEFSPQGLKTITNPTDHEMCGDWVGVFLAHKDVSMIRGKAFVVAVPRIHKTCVDAVSKVLQ